MFEIYKDTLNEFLGFERAPGELLVRVDPDYTGLPIPHLPDGGLYWVDTQQLLKGTWSPANIRREGASVLLETMRDAQYSDLAMMLVMCLASMKTPDSLVRRVDGHPWENWVSNRRGMEFFLEEVLATSQAFVRYDGNIPQYLDLDPQDFYRSYIPRYIDIPKPFVDECMRARPPYSFVSLCALEHVQMLRELTPIYIQREIAS